MTARDWLLALDTYTNGTYGRPASSAVADGTCVCCGGVTGSFTTANAKAVYSQAGLCERCQNTHQSISDKIVPFNQSYRELNGPTTAKRARE